MFPAKLQLRYDSFPIGWRLKPRLGAFGHEVRLRGLDLYIALDSVPIRRWLYGYARAARMRLIASTIASFSATVL